jgi:hypothetical protein
VADIQPSLDESYFGDVVAVHIDDLHDGVTLGIAQMFEDSTRDAALAQRISFKALGFFASMGDDADVGTPS